MCRSDPQFGQKASPDSAWHFGQTIGQPIGSDFPGCPLIQDALEGTSFPRLACIVHKSDDLRKPGKPLLCVHSRELTMAIEIFRPQFRPTSQIDYKSSIFCLVLHLMLVYDRRFLSGL